MRELVVATWNIHSGVDGWGRPFDVVAGCRAMHADVLCLQETWAYEGGASNAQQVADALGYTATEVQIARGVMFAPPAQVTTRRWGPPARVKSRHGPRLVGALRKVPVGSSEAGSARLGTIGLAILTRFDGVESHVADLGCFMHDPTRRSVVALEIPLDRFQLAGGGSVVVAGTHLSHLRHGSPAQVGRLRGHVEAFSSRAGAIVLAGDMNLPGPVMRAALPGWRRLVKGRSWPSWRPLLQPDHVFVKGKVAGSGSVLRIGGSDHLPVRVVLRIG